MKNLNEFFPTKVQFEVKIVTEVPAEYYDAKNWEQGIGVYYHEEKDCMYFVNKYSVDTIWNPSQKGLFEVIEDTFHSPKVEEDLLLRAIAAMNGHRI
jgi:hypothetical protein